MKEQALKAAVVAVAVFGFAAAPAGAQQDMSNVEITATYIVDDIYMLQGRGGNIGVSVGEDGAFVIDDQFAPLTEKILAAIAAVTDQPVRWVLNTHWHGDHTGGNENLGQTGAMIDAHENVRRRMDPQSYRDLMGRSNQAPPGALPVVTFSDEVNFHWNGQHINVFHAAHAHTDGDAVVIFQDANVVHMGDSFFNGRYPFVDMGSGGNVNGMIDAAERVLAFANSNTKIIPGHGDLAGPEELAAFRDMLVTVRDRISLLVNDRMGEDRVVAAKPTSDLDGTWGENPERFVRAVYQSLRD